jgi:hypothetical protein
LFLYYLSLFFFFFFFYFFLFSFSFGPRDFERRGYSVGDQVAGFDLEHG